MQWLRRLLRHTVIDYKEAQLFKQKKGETRAEKIEACLKDYRTSIVAQLVVVLIYSIFLIILLSQFTNIVVITLDGLDVILSVSFIGFGYQLYCQIRRYYELHRLAQDGPEIAADSSTVKPLRNIQKLDMWVGVISLSLTLLCVVTPIISMTQRVDKGLPENRETIPSISLAVFENHASYRKRPSPEYRGDSEFLNRLTSKWSLTVPKQYEIHENGEIPEIIWSDKSGVYSPSMTTHYYETSLKWMATPLFEYVVEDKMVHYTGGSQPRPESIEGFDEVYVIEEGIRKEVAFRKGNQVGLVTYYGTKTMEELMVAVTRQYKEDN